MVSILCLSWNHEKYIAQALNSLIAQTYRDIEIIYLDNCSKDSTYKIATDILSSSGIKYSAFQREVPCGLSQNQNFLFSKTSGEFFSMCSGDDWLHEDSVKIKMNYLDDPAVGMVYSDGYKYYDDLDIYEPFIGEHFEYPETLNELYKRNFISALGCIIRRSVIETVGLWDETLLIEDGDMWVRIASKYHILHIKDRLFYYRKHALALSNNYDYMYRAKMELYEKYKAVNPFNDIWLSNARKNYLSNRVMSNTSFSTLREVLKDFRPDKFYSKLLLKSLVPVSLKIWYHKRSLIAKWKRQSS